MIPLVTIPLITLVTRLITLRRRRVCDSPRILSHSEQLPFMHPIIVQVET